MWSRIVFFFPWVVVCWSQLFGASVQAKAPRPQVILLARPAERIEAIKMAKVLRYQLLGSGAGLTLKWVAPSTKDLSKLARQIAVAQRPLMVVWHGAVGRNKIHLYYPRPGTTSGRIRTVAREASSQSGRIEVAGLIVRTSVEAILSSRAMKRPASRPRPPDVVARRTQPRPKPRVSCAVALQYVFMGYSPDTSQAIAHAGALELQLTYLRRWSVYLGYGVTPLVARQDGVTLKQQRHGFALGGAHSWRWGRTAVSARLALETDVVRSEIEENGSFDVNSPFLDVNVGVSASVRLDIALTDRVGIHTGVGAVFVLLNSDYSVVNLLLSKPWSVRPLWFVGMNVRFY